jgi:hypothetical protein
MEKKPPSKLRIDLSAIRYLLTLTPEELAWPRRSAQSATVRSSRWKASR